MEEPARGSAERGIIPIVFAQVADPVGLGFVRSLARPGDNITGFSTYDAGLMGEWLGLLKEVARIASLDACGDEARTVTRQLYPSLNTLENLVLENPRAFDILLRAAPSRAESGFNENHRGGAIDHALRTCGNERAREAFQQ
jgi:hypothetical protein